MRLIDLASEKLIRLITVDQKYKAGDKLPNEKELADELGVSRNTLRAAVQQLVGQGVLKIRRGRGTYVASGWSRNSPPPRLPGRPKKTSPR